ncbi:MAG TPA: hypothetical protein VJT67_10725 [Longimicrobiaceae bacterium]|nr:hypothetical protein [Longimicrobiaceae bacterium]
MSRISRFVALAAGLAALGACSDSPSNPKGGEPDDNVQVQVVAAINGATVTPQNDSVALVECTLALQATATTTGAVQAAASWSSAKFFFYVGPNRATPSDSAIVDANDVAASWGNRQIVAGTVQTAQWQLRAGVPFAIAGELQYHTSGNTTVHVARFEPVACGGPAVPPGAAAPTISNLQVSPAGGEMEAKDSITVSWQTTAPAGLWQSLVTVVTGNKTGHYFTRGAFQTTDGRTMKVRLPYHAGLGSPAQVSVTVTDAWLRGASAGPRATATVVDRTPPQLLAASTSSYLGDLSGARLNGQFGVGDSVKISHVAGDENGLANMVWEIDAPISVRDSTPLVGTGMVAFPVKAGWNGAATLRLWVTDEGGNRSTVMESPANGFRFYPIVSRPAQSMTLPDSYRDVVLDPVARKVYLVLEARKQIVPVSLGSMTAGTPIDLPSFPSAADLTPGRDSLVVALQPQHAIGLVDLATSKVTVVPVNAPDLGGPFALRVGANGRVIAAMTSLADHSLVMVEIDRGTGAVVQNGTGSISSTFTVYMRATADRSRIGLASSCVYVYQVAAGTLGECLPGGTRGYVAFDAQAQIYTAAERIFSTTAGGIYTFQEVPAVTASAPGPDGFIYVSSTKGLMRARTDGAILDRSELPLLYGDLLFLDGGNTLVGFTNEGAGNNKMFVVTLH